MVTLSDVAKQANVSKMTVSRVINHPEQVTAELRQLVEAAMTTLDYRPNAAAKALANNRTNVVKLVILEDIDTTEPYYMSLLFGIAKGLDKRGYALQLVTERAPRHRQRRRWLYRYRRSGLRPAPNRCAGQANSDFRRKS